MEDDTHVSPAPGLIARRVADEVFILMADSTVHWLKNPTAVAVWGALADGGTTVGLLADLLTAQFEVDRAQARADLQPFLAHLEGAGVISTAPSAERG